ncbi:DNA polymerase II small subunit [Natronoarchaeum philippinense]|uniref:DNA polymerase II small subunit n=1 Tax=Natronoarchaeum philippinense TaxID=558529 RepID=A0A285NZL1_NATPI|nr:DNA-directed DNA polymerase II small subunit [Natronoarchaeum philippinense]SNZ14900.1 DNA polymerase II small subunit [Natronoarchaeum philippinense]
MPLEAPARIVRALATRGFNADREAVTLIASADDPGRALEAAVEAAPEDALTITAEHVRTVLDGGVAADASTSNSSVSTGDHTENPPDESAGSPAEAMGVGSGDSVTASSGNDRPAAHTDGPELAQRDDSQRSLDIANDITGRSTGTGEYDDFVTVFRDRFERLSGKLRGRVNHRPTDTLEAMGGGSDAAIVGMVNDIRSTASGHWLIELEDTSGVFPCLVMKDRRFADQVDELLCDEVIAVEGTLADDGGILFVDSMYFPDVPRTFEPSTADRHVQAALISDVHVGSQEFMADAWERFADWLHTAEAENIEYLLIAGDMVEGVGVYPDQDDELDIVDIYEQYEAFSEHLKQVPGDIEIVMIPGNHDAVRLAEPQPGFDEELREIMSAHDARITGNPSTVTIEGVSVLMYHGVSLDEIIAEFPDDKATYDDPQKPMYHLLKKRHVAPQYGGHMRLAPEEKDYLVIDEVPDIFHTGHVHKLGYGKYHNVLAINSGCWQAQTEFQKSVNIDPDTAYAPVVDLDTLDVTIRKFD